MHFAAFKNHIGFFPAPSGIENFKGELAKYKTSKGTVQFPLDDGIPMGVVRVFVRFRLKENLSKGKSQIQQITEFLYDHTIKLEFFRLTQGSLNVRFMMVIIILVIILFVAVNAYII